MRSQQLSRFALSACAATVMLAGCGGSQPPIGAPGAMPQSRASSSNGYDALYSFGKRSSDGQEPMAGLTDVNGTLYGTTYKGGKYGAGTVFSTSTAGTEKVLYSFNTYSKDNDGANPTASLIAVKGALYGTTEYGGLTADPSNGTVFRVSTTGAEKVLYRFYGYYYHGHLYEDGANPLAGLTDVRGKLYGTTLSGGNGEFSGTVFRITTSGREKVVYSFGYGSPGQNPIAGLVNLDGTLYGTTKIWRRDQQQFWLRNGVRGYPSRYREAVARFLSLGWVLSRGRSDRCQRHAVRDDTSRWRLRGRHRLQHYDGRRLNQPP